MSRAALPATTNTNAYQEARTIRRVLDSMRTIAIVGLSPQTIRASYFVGYYLSYRGYRIVPVNPTLEELFGQPAYPTLSAIPFPIDVVDVFRRSEDAGQFVDEAVEIGAKAVWFQLGVVDDAAYARAREAGLHMVMDVCPAIEWRSR